MENNIENFEFNYGIIAVDKRSVDAGQDVEILHFCGYPEEPSAEDYQALYDELSTDTTFGLVEIMEHIQLAEAPNEIVQQYKLMIENQNNG